MFEGGQRKLSTCSRGTKGFIIVEHFNTPIIVDNSKPILIDIVLALNSS